MHNPTHRPPHLPLKPFRAAWNPDSFIYTDGSQKTGNPILGASIVNPQTQTTTHIETKSQPERHIINRVELAAITVALDLHNNSPQIHILTDSAFSINTLRNLAIDPLRYAHHPHKELLREADALIETRDENGLLTHIGRVKSRAEVTHNDEADAGARGVVDGDSLPDIIFPDADPPIGGLRTWPMIKVTHADNYCIKIKLTNIHTGLRKIIKAQNHATLCTNNTIYNTILRKARETGVDHSIHGYSTAPYKARRDSLEVA